MKFFDFEEPQNTHLADDQPCFAVLYNPIFYIFITAHSKSIKIWDATTGIFKNRFRGKNNEPMKGDVTCICMDDRKRKLFYGTSRGKLKSINMKNGAVGRKFKKDRGSKKNFGSDFDDKNDKKTAQDISCIKYWS